MKKERPTVILTAEMVRVMRKVELINRFNEHSQDERTLNMRETNYWRNQWKLLARDMVEFLKEFN